MSIKGYEFFVDTKWRALAEDEIVLYLSSGVIGTSTLVKHEGNQVKFTQIPELMKLWRSTPQPCPSCDGRIEENTEKIWCYTDRYLRLIGPLYVKDLINDYIDKEINKNTKILNKKLNEWRPLLEWELLTSVYEQDSHVAKNKQYLYKNRDMELIGPFSSDELKLAYKRNEINNNTDILHKNNMLWRKLSSWPELKSVYSNDTKLSSRKLCSDGSCIGVIGDNGNCKVCGNKYEEENEAIEENKENAKCKSCGFIVFGKDQDVASREVCTNCGEIVGYEPSISLIKCGGCGQKISKKAKECPKCGWHPLATCQVCSQKIPINSVTCPACGDPEPFVQNDKCLKQTITQEKNVKPRPGKLAATQPAAKVEKNISKDSAVITQYKYLNDPSSVTKTLKFMLWVAIGIGMLSIISDFMQIELLRGNYTMEEIKSTDTRQQFIGMVYLIIYIITGIIFLSWVFKANSNSHNFGAQNMKFTPGWAVGWYFVPAANLWKPYQVMKEIWKVSKNPSNWQSETGSPLLVSWWTIWLLSNILGQSFFRMSLKIETIDDLKAFSMVSIVFCIADIILCAIVLSIVTDIYINQERLVRTRA